MHARAVICILLATATAASASALAARTSAPTTSPGAPTTPPGYTYNASTGSYYKVHREREVTWDVANATCAREGAHVLVLNDAKEADIVADIVWDAGQRITWTGLRDNRPGGVMEWRTVHDEPVSDVYNVWAPGQPRNDTGWTCAIFGGANKRLYNFPCDLVFYATCEISE